MKKMVFMAAFVAATAAFVACSNENDLVQQAPTAPEETIDEGVPMIVKVADLASRGTDLTTSTLENFTLYSTMTSAWSTGKLFGKDDGGNWTTNTDLTWPDANTYTFFGISDVTNLADLDDDSHKDAPVVTATTCSFNYAMPQEEKASDPGNYWCNSENLPDLLVSKNTGSSTLNDGALTVDFTHALAQIKAINIYANSTRLEAKNVTDHQTYRFRINGIRLGGLKYIGTYTFDANPAWTVSGDDTEFTIPLTDAGLTYEDASFKPGTTKASGITLPLTDGGLYLIPQVAAGYFEVDGEGFYSSVGAYAELDAQVFVYRFANKTTEEDEGIYKSCSSTNTQVLFDEIGSDAAGYGLIRVPLKFSLVPGYGYTLTLDLSRGVFYDGDFDGDPIFSGITFDSGS
jgi:hypothetical protein